MSEMSLDEALAEVGKFGKITKGFEKVAEVAATLAGAEQLVRERTDKAAALAAQIATLETARNNAAAAVDEARSFAVSLTGKAEAQASGILEEARAAARIAKRDSDASVQQAGVELGKAQAALADVLSKIRAAEVELAAIETRRTAALEAARKAFGG
jgi:formylmethanofuran dehydrogenase subunit B